jgi:hypothetical protein
MRRKLAVLFLVGVLGSMLVGARLADAHQCPEPKHDGKVKQSEECHETAVYDDWRPNYVPLFDLSDRDGDDGEQQRRDAQRWREECADGDQERQQCAWYYGGTSIGGSVLDGEYDPYDTDEEDGPRPNELHVGFGATHCFLAEAAHDCDAHGDSNEFATHDSHGGATYVDVCLTSNPNSKYCDEGTKDTQVGVTAVDHLTCPMGCMDEYHVIRPLDTDYTAEQMADSQAAILAIPSDPLTYLCGYPDPHQEPPCDRAE